MARPANLLFILSDNHNRSLLGCYGDALVRTPNIDGLAVSGARFANAYSASPLCCPARAALATGRYPHQTGYWDNALVYDGRVRSWMHRLRDAGVDTASVGKLHFRSADDDNGFARELIPMHITEGRGAVQNLLRGYDAELNGTHARRWELYLEKSGPGETHYQEYDRDITRHALDWLAEKADARDPWALFVSYVSPHPPFTVPERLLDLYPPDRIALPPHCAPHVRSMHAAAEYHRQKFGVRGALDEASLKRLTAAYCALITHLDEQVGIVLEWLRGAGLAGNTTIVYSSDHGEMRGAHGLLGKGVMYEDALAVPLIFSGVSVPPGRVVRQTVSHVDLYPTLLEHFGIPASEEERTLHGVSLWPAMRGEESQRQGFAEYHANFSRSGSFMLRDGDLKLVYHVGMPAQLFDLAADPWEMNDIAATEHGRARVKRLEAELRRICDPEAVDERAKADQRRRGDEFGGMAALAQAPSISFSPPPGLKGEDIGAIVPGAPS